MPLRPSKLYRQTNTQPAEVVEPGDLTGHGGRRPGAGRKHIDPKGNTARVTVRLSQEQAAWLDAQDGTPVAVIRQLIDAARGV